MISTWGSANGASELLACYAPAHMCMTDRPALAATQPSSPAHRLAINSDAAERDCLVPVYIRKHVMRLVLLQPQGRAHD
jgi:hypothetical protein